jgi:DNA-directed RNA polymerase specialized sigma24 family protein
MKEHNEDPIVAELRRITKLLALSIVKNIGSPREQITFLHQLGFQNTEISDLLKIPEGTVASNLSRAKAEAKKGQEKKKQN